MRKSQCARKKSFQLDSGLYGQLFLQFLKQWMRISGYKFREEATLSIWDLDLNENIKDKINKDKNDLLKSETISNPLQNVSNLLKQLSRKIDQLQKEFSRLKVTASQL